MLNLPGSIANIFFPLIGGAINKFFTFEAKTSMAACSAFRNNSDLTCRVNKGITVNKIIKHE